MLQKNNVTITDQDIISIIKKSGYHKLTPIQKKVIPQCLQGKDLLVETKNSRGKTAAFLLPLFQMINSPSQGTQVLIITTEGWAVRKVEKQFNLFKSQTNSTLTIGAVGHEKNIKKELSIKRIRPDIIVGTNIRIIDHIRRENIDISNAGIVILYKVNHQENENFNRDIQFILSKINKKPQIIYFTPKINEEQFPEIFSRKPQIISCSAHETVPEKERIYFEITNNEEKINLISALFFQNGIKKSLIFSGKDEACNFIEKKLCEKGIVCRCLTSKTPKEKRESIETSFSSGNLEHLILPFSYFIKQVQITDQLSGGTCIFFDIPADENSFATFLASSNNAKSFSQYIVFINSKQSKFFEALQEKNNMSFEKEVKPENKDILKGMLKNFIKKIREEEDPEELNSYKKIIKRYVPITLRTYLSAYMLKEIAGKDTPKERDYKTLFVSVGKNRRVFPKDLSRLFSGSLKIDRSRIGGIKVLENYSFIDIPSNLSEQAIEKLNGVDFRGRKITVNYARKKEE